MVRPDAKVEKVYLYRQLIKADLADCSLGIDTKSKQNNTLSPIGRSG